MIKMKLFAAAFLLSAPQLLQAQCDGQRFFSPVFSNVEVVSDNKYGENLDVDGNNTELFFDFYAPEGDQMEERPLVILAHGGSFIGGERTGADVVPLANDLAKHGFAVASISYRLGIEGFPLGIDSVTASEAVIRAVHDMRAAVRFFRKDYQAGNGLKIDPNAIYVAGVSAGAFMALHLAYLDEESEIPDYVDQNKPGLTGGIEGESGNPGFSSEARAVVNIAGALRDKNWLKAGDEPLISFHGTDDQTVPYGTDMLTFLGFVDIFVVDGSKSVHDHAVSVGVNSCMETQYGQDHIPHVENAQYYDTVLVMTRNFMASDFCNATFSCEYGNVSAVADLSRNTGVSLFPNPSDGYIQFSSPINQLKVFNNIGQLVFEKTESSAFSEVDLQRLDPGVFYIVMEDEEHLPQRIILQ
ncbi:MAG: para-nitrobenzyl esterase [Sphingobacteriales bacterium]|jgi:para-nitrobenzyl esterase